MFCGFFLLNFLKYCPRGGLLARFSCPRGRIFVISLCPGVGNSPFQKIAGGLPGGWSGLELTDTLPESSGGETDLWVFGKRTIWTKISLDYII